MTNEEEYPDFTGGDFVAMGVLCVVWLGVVPVLVRYYLQRTGRGGERGKTWTYAGGWVHVLPYWAQVVPVAAGLVLIGIGIRKG